MDSGNRMTGLAQFRSLRSRLRKAEKTKPSKANVSKLLVVRKIAGNHKKQSQSIYPQFYHSLTAIPPPILEKLVPIRTAGPDLAGMMKTKPSKANEAKPNEINPMLGKIRKQSHGTYQSYYQSLTAILSTILQKLVPIPIAYPHWVPRSRRWLEGLRT